MKIPTYEPRVDIPAEGTAGRAQFAPLDFLSEVPEAMGRAARSMGAAASAMAEAQRRRREEDDFNWVVEATNAFSEGWRNAFSEELQKTGRDTFGNVERMNEFIKAQTDHAVQSAPSERAKQAFGVKIASLTDHMLDSLARLQVGERKSVGIKNLETVKESHRKNAYLDPDNVDRYAADALGTLDGALASGILPVDADSAARIGVKTEQEIYGAALDGYLDRSPALAREKLKDFTPFLSADQLNAYSDRIAAKERGIESEADQAARQKLRDLSSRSEDTLATIATNGQEGVDLEAELRAVGTEEAHRVADTYARKRKIALDAYQVLSGSSDRSFAERIEQADAAFAVKPGEVGAADKIQARAMAMQSLRDQTAAFLKDPSEYVASMVDHAAVPDESPEARVDRSMEIQRKLGEGLRDFRPRAVSKAALDNMTQEWSRLDADGKLSYLETVVDRYGKYAPQLLTDMKLGGSVQLAQVAMASDKTNRAMARALIEASSLKDDDIPGSPESKTRLRKEFMGELETSPAWSALTGTYKYQPQNSAQGKFLAELQAAMTRTALMTGDARKAAELLDATYQSVSEADLAHVVFPRGAMDPDDVESGLNQARENIEPFIRWQADGMTKELFAERVRDVKTRGVWVNGSDPGTFVLLHPATGLAVTDREGKPYQVTLDQLKQTQEGVVPWWKRALKSFGGHEAAMRGRKYPITESMKLGALSQRFESNGDPGAIGYDEVGGTSYGTYQIASRTGTFDNFLTYLKEADPSVYGQLAKAGQANTGSTAGSVPTMWTRIAKEQPERFAQLQHDFIEHTHYQPAAETILRQTGVDVAQQPEAVRQVLWSTATGHGPGGAAKIFGEAIARVGTKDLVKLLQAVYDIRKTQYGSSTDSVRKAVQKRYDKESSLAIRNLMLG